MPELWDGLVVGASLAALEGDAGWGAIEDGALGWRDGRIVFMDAAPTCRANERLADIWSRPVAAGSRPASSTTPPGSAAIAPRVRTAAQGASYEEIARSAAASPWRDPRSRRCSRSAAAGPGAAGHGDHADQVRRRDLDGGAGCCVARHRTVPGVDVRNHLGARRAAGTGRAEAYIDAVCQWLPRLHGESLVDAVDAFAEHQPPQRRPPRAEAARALGLPVARRPAQRRRRRGAGGRIRGLSADRQYLVRGRGRHGPPAR